MTRTNQEFNWRAGGDTINWFHSCSTILFLVVIQKKNTFILYPPEVLTSNGMGKLCVLVWFHPISEFAIYPLKNLNSPSDLHQQNKLIFLNYKSLKSPWFLASILIPSGKKLHNYGKIHHLQWVNPLILWSCSIFPEGVSNFYGNNCIEILDFP